MAASSIMTPDGAATTQQTALSRARSSRGMALLSVLLVLMILSGLAAAMTTSGQTELLVARNTVSSAQAAAAAEAGLNHGAELAIPFVQQYLANGFASPTAAMTGLVQGPDGLTGNANADADNGSLENLGIPRPPAQLALGAVFGVTYEVRVLDEDDPARGITLTAADLARIEAAGDPTTDANSTVVVQAIGYATDNTRVTYETTIASSAASLPALAVGGDLEISGNPTIIGGLGGGACHRRPGHLREPEHRGRRHGGGHLHRIGQPHDRRHLRGGTRVPADSGGGRYRPQAERRLHLDQHRANDQPGGRGDLRRVGGGRCL